MKMAKATEADLDAAMKLCSALESMARYRTMPMPDDDPNELDKFDAGNGEDCKKALSIVLELSERASLFRVVFGMAVLLDPANEIVDPVESVLQLHPKLAHALAVEEATEGLLAALERIAKYPRVSGDELGYSGCRAVARDALTAYNTSAANGRTDHESKGSSSSSAAAPAPP